MDATAHATDRGTGLRRARGDGLDLGAYADATFRVEDEDEALTLHLTKAGRQFKGAKASTRYRFAVLEREDLPEDQEA